MSIGKDLIIHPGETLKEFFDNRSTDVRVFAAVYGISYLYIYLVLSGEKPITPKLAIALETEFKVDANFWINLQKNYDKELEDTK